MQLKQRRKITISLQVDMLNSDSHTAIRGCKTRAYTLNRAKLEIIRTGK
jgi:hypothetical protein